jgi:hypothetical protein
MAVITAPESATAGLIEAGFMTSAVTTCSRAWAGTGEREAAACLRGAGRTASLQLDHPGP